MDRTYQLVSETLLQESRYRELDIVLKDLLLSMQKKIRKPTRLIQSFLSKKNEIEENIQATKYFVNIEKLNKMTMRMIRAAKKSPSISKAISAMAISRSLQNKTNPKTELLNIGNTIQEKKATKIPAISFILAMMTPQIGKVFYHLQAYVILQIITSWFQFE